NGRFKAMIRGVLTLPWNLIITTILGIVLMALPEQIVLPPLLSNVTHVVGALVITFSVMSMAEVIRKLRFILLPLAALLLLSPWIFDGRDLLIEWSYSIIAILLALFSLRQGRIKERYGK